MTYVDTSTVLEFALDRIKTNIDADISGGDLDYHFKFSLVEKPDPDIINLYKEYDLNPGLFGSVLQEFLDYFAGNWQDTLDSLELELDEHEEILEEATSSSGTDGFNHTPKRWEWMNEYNVEEHNILPSGSGYGDMVTNAVSEASSQVEYELMKLMLAEFLEEFSDDLAYEDPRQERLKF